MPYIDVLVQPAATPEQAAALAQGITDAMDHVLGKRREVTAVRVAGADTTLWTIGARPPFLPTAFVDVRITAGTNTAGQKAALLQRLHGMLEQTLGGVAEASYIMIHELPAQDWGYGGISQAARAGRAA